jgi:hypothetical protein
MHSKLLLLPALAAAMLLLAGGATAGQKGKPWPYPIGLTVSGSKSVAPNVLINRYVVVHNNTTHNFRRLKVMFTPADIIVKSRKRFKTITLQVYAPRTTARWLFRNLRLRPKTSMRIPVTLKFPATAPDGSSVIGIILDGQELGRREGAFSTGSVVMHIAPTG